jgi:N-acetylneuraminic acid mutarotase
VDIFDTLTGEWTVENLSVPRGAVAVVSHGNKVLFAGGAHYGLQLIYDIVDIYDIETGQWSTATLSEARDARSAAVVGDIAIFAGGFDWHNVSKRVDIYNFTTDTWSIDSLSVARECAAAVTVGNKVLIAGGMTAENQRTDVVDIYDATTGTWSTASLSFPRAFSNNLCAAAVGGKAFFAGGGNLNLNNIYWTIYYNFIDIYDEATNTWSTDQLVDPRIEQSVVAAGNKLIVAGGLNGTGYLSSVEILDVQHTGIPAMATESMLSSSPNPFNDQVTFTFTLNEPETITLEIMNMSGQAVAVIMNENIPAGRNQVTWKSATLAPGIYFYRLSTNGDLKPITGKLIKLKSL